MIDKLTRLDFEALAPGSLRVRMGEQEVPLDLVEVRDLPDRSSRDKPFALVLQGPRSPFLPQAIHTLIHPVHGALELFMVPIGQDASHTRYELVFN